MLSCHFKSGGCMSNRFLEGVVVGAVIGAGVTLLLAPQSGKETRRLLRRLKDDRRELLESTKQKTDELIGKAVYAIENGFDRVTRLVDRKKSDEYEECHG
ncbi:YtxH domain-containing protein [bacterium]|nr:YtxH domain-containing protein [bacterium]